MPVGCLVIVPVLGRPENAAPLVESLVESVDHPSLRADLLFVCSPKDTDEIDACRVAAESAPWRSTVEVEIADWFPGLGDYAKKINLGWRWKRPEHDLVLLGADDLRFHPGWLIVAAAAQITSGACVIGTNDLGNRSTGEGGSGHSTHPIVHRGYSCGLIDDPDPGKLLHEGYRHNYVDNEFVATARARGVYVHDPMIRVEHLHPFWGTAAQDETYERGHAGMADDRRLFNSRQPLWASGAVR